MNRLPSRLFCLRFVCRLWLRVFLISGNALGLAAAPTAPWEDVALSAGVLSAYVSEGREDFAGAVTFAGGIGAEWRSIALELYHLAACGNDGTEWDATVATGGNWAGLEWAAGLTHIRYRFAGDNVDDEEIAGELSWPLGERLVLGADGVYSFDADGTHWTVGLAYLVPTGGEVELELIASVSYEAGYRSPGFRGIDHATLGAAMSAPLGGRLHLHGFVETTFALDGVRHDGGGDQFYGGASLSMEF